MKEKTLRALGDRIIIRFEKIKQEKKVTPGGIELISAEKEEVMHEAIVETIGNRVPEDCGFKVGDSIVFNDHDIKQFDEPNPLDIMEPIRKGIVAYNSVWGIYE